MGRIIIFRLRVMYNRLVTVRKGLLYTLGVAICLILLFDFYLFNIPNWFSKADVWGQIFYKICFAYITGFIFFFINVHLQNERAKVKMHLYIHNKIADILSANQDLIATIILNSNETITNYRPEKQELKEYCLKVNPHKYCSIPKLPGFFENWFVAINHIHKINKEAIDDLFNIRDNISIDVLELLSKIEDTLKNHVNLTKGLSMGNQDLEVFHHGIYDYTNYAYALKKTFDEKYQRHSWESNELFKQRKLKGKEHLSLPQK